MYFVVAILSFGVPSLYAANQFVGAGKCKSCHKKKKDGNQYGVWQKSEHAKAFKLLGTKEAKAAAKKVGVAGDPQKAKECLICHASPKYDSNGKENPASMFGKKFKMEEGVQCESCHGAGQKYVKKKTMKAITKEGGAAKSATAKKTGLVAVNKAVCEQCHVAQVTIGGVAYKNPTFEGFDFEKQLKEIAHPKP